MSASGGGDGAAQDGIHRPSGLGRVLGPGLVGGASDVDPTTVGTVSAVGATTGYRLSWLTVLVFPLLAVVQSISTEVGMATGRDLEDVTAQRFGPAWGFVLLVSVLAVNVVTIAADLEAGAAALGLLTGGAWQWFVVPLAVALLAVLLVGSFDEVERVLRAVLVGLFAYAGAAVLARPHWGDVLRHTVVPSLSLSSTGLADALAIVGTTLTSYAYVWQTVAYAGRVDHDVRRARTDAVAGSFFATAVMWFILIATGATLGAHHHAINTAGEAAEALRPLAGPAAATIFGVGLFASAVLALPILMITTAHVVGSEFNWRVGITSGVPHAARFYGAMAAAVALAAGIALGGVAPIRILYIASIAGGLATPVSLVFLLLVAGDSRAMHGQPITGRLAAAGWAVTAVVSLAGLAFLATQLAG
jgi:Mn2+/Fe2+ NRAMP family transporter